MIDSAHPQVIIQPDEGTAPVAALIASAQQSLLIKQFTFTAPELIEAVAERARAGVDVRVMLNPQRSSGTRANDETMKTLAAAGVKAKWSSSRFAVTHEKSIVIDYERALIATFNLCEKYFTHTRDYGIVIDDIERVGEIVGAFEADWEEKLWTPNPDSGLLWSNENSRRLMSEFIDATQERLDVQHPKFVDAVILERLIDAADRGVRVRILCGGRHGISAYDILDTFACLRVLTKAGVRVNKQKQMRLHAKLLISDRKRALVGSMNIDRSAFDLRRELSVCVDEHAAVRALRDVFGADWELSDRYKVPDPLVAFEHHETDFPHDPELDHE
ncbi:MAG: phosphatidylserine/phosphatidylglycerophosphate/cardiolipin synthase family protein [Hyphomicrobiales bacterium]